MRKTPAISIASGSGIGLILHLLDVAFKVKNYPAWKEWVGDMDPDILTVWTPVFLGFGIAAIWWSREWYQSRPKFDMPFEAAISHRLTHKTRDVVSYAWQTSERIAVKSIHHQACLGTIRISGTAQRKEVPRRIPRRILKALTPIDGVTANGYVWMLFPKDIQPDFKEHSIEEDDGSYWNLRVDSRDLYKIWPKTSQP